MGKEKNKMYKVSEEDRNVLFGYFRNTVMTRIQSDPYVAKIQDWKKSEDKMWLVPVDDQKLLVGYFGNYPMPWVQSNPIITRIASWQKTESKEKNGKDKPQ